MDHYIDNLDAADALKFTLNILERNISCEENLRFTACMKWVSPFGMLITSKAIRDLHSMYPDIPFYMRCLNTEAVDYAGHMGFFRSISESLTLGNQPGEARGNGNYIPITQLDFDKLHDDDIISGKYGALGETVERKAGDLSKVICRDNVEMRYLMTYLIREILRNIPEHSGQNTAFICGQYWPKRNTAEIAIVDDGIGIRRSLQSNCVYKPHVNDDEAACQNAIKPGISEAYKTRRNNHGVWANSGYGLYMVSEICKEMKGSFCLASGQKYIEVAQDGTISAGDTSIKGTAVRVAFSTDSLGKSHDIIDRILHRGEDEAKTVRNAFKIASQPSRGLTSK